MHAKAMGREADIEPESASARSHGSFLVSDVEWKHQLLYPAREPPSSPLRAKQQQTPIRVALRCTADP